MTIEEVMEYAVTHNCSDVHITQGTNLAVRRFGMLHILDERPTSEESQEMIYSILSRDEIARVEAGEDVDTGLYIGEGIRVRANVYHQRNNLACSIRLLMSEIPEFEALGLPDVIKSLATANNGIILVTGPTGSGKTTTLSAIVDYINKNEAKHVITIEDPIEYIYPHNRAMIHQREVGRDVPSFADALHSALREDPDIILVGEMRDFETIQAAITAAETGHLVFGTLHTSSASQTIDRIIDVFPEGQQQQIRVQLANSLVAVFAQTLLPKIQPDGTKKGRTMAQEIMVVTPAVANLIREAKAAQIYSTIQTSQGVGMQTLEMSLAKLYKNKLVTLEDALSRSSRPDELKRQIQLS